MTSFASLFLLLISLQPPFSLPILPFCAFSFFTSQSFEWETKKKRIFPILFYFLKGKRRKRNQNPKQYLLEIALVLTWMKQNWSGGEEKRGWNVKEEGNWAKDQGKRSGNVGGRKPAKENARAFEIALRIGERGKRKSKIENLDRMNRERFLINRGGPVKYFQHFSKDYTSRTSH